MEVAGGKGQGGLLPQTGLPLRTPRCNRPMDETTSSEAFGLKPAREGKRSGVVSTGGAGSVRSALRGDAPTLVDPDNAG